MKTSPWAKKAETSIDLADRELTKSVKGLNQQLHHLDRWGHREINAYLSGMIETFPQENRHAQLASSSAFRGIHVLVIDSIEQLIGNTGDIPGIVDRFSETIADGITGTEDWPLKSCDIMREIEQAEDRYDAIIAPTDTHQAELVTRLYTSFMEHAGYTIDASKFNDYVQPQMLENLASKSGKLANALSGTKVVDVIFESHSQPPARNFMNDGYNALSHFLGARIAELNTLRDSDAVTPAQIRKLSEESLEAFEGLVTDLRVYKAVLHNLRDGLNETYNEGLWPSLYEKASQIMVAETGENDDLPPLTKESGIGQFVEETLYENRHVTADVRNFAVLGFVLKGLSDSFPSRTLQKLVI